MIFPHAAVAFPSAVIVLGIVYGKQVQSLAEKFGFALLPRASTLAMSRSGRTHLRSAWRIRASFRTVMALERSTKPVTEFLRNGLADRCGATELNRTDHLARRRSLQPFLSINSLPCPRMCRWSRAHV